MKRFRQIWNLSEFPWSDWNWHVHTNNYVSVHTHASEIINCKFAFHLKNLAKARFLNPLTFFFSLKLFSQLMINQNYLKSAYNNSNFYLSFTWKDFWNLKHGPITEVPHVLLLSNLKLLNVVWSVVLICDTVRKTDKNSFNFHVMVDKLLKCKSG